MYNVERILDKKFENGQTYYRIKWKGWKMADATWEPLENLNNIDEMISEFNSNFKENIEKKNPHVGSGLRKCKKDKDVLSLSLESENSNGEGEVEELACPTSVSKELVKKKGRGRPKGSTKSNAVTKEDSSDEQPVTKAKKIKKKSLLEDVDMNNEINVENNADVNDLSDVHSVSCLDTSGVNTKSAISIEMPELILSAKRNNDDGEIYFLCKWKVKKNKAKLADCYIENDSMKAYFPKLLLDFYEKKLFPNEN